MSGFFAFSKPVFTVLKDLMNLGIPLVPGDVDSDCRTSGLCGFWEAALLMGPFPQHHYMDPTDSVPMLDPIK